MHALAKWIHIKFANGRGALVVAVATCPARRARRGSLAARHCPERSIDDDGVQLLDSELGSTAAPFAEDRPIGDLKSPRSL